MTQTKPVILQILPSLVNGGVEQGTLDLAKAIHDKGWVSYVASAGGPLITELTKAESGHITLPLNTKNPLQILMNAYRLYTLIKKLKIDIIHARSRAPAWSAWIATRFTKTPFITTIHGAYRNSNIFKKLYNSGMIRGDHLIAVSNFIANYIKTEFSPERPIHTILRGIDEKYLSHDVPQDQIERLVHSWNIHPLKRPVILLPARINADKGHRIAMEALTLIPNATLICVGKEKEGRDTLSKLTHYTKKLGVTERVFFPGICADMKAAYAMADLVILPTTKPESFGRVAVEAMAAGKIVIASNIGGTAETIIDGHTGFLCEAGRVLNLAEKINNAIAMPADEKEKMQRLAQNHVRQYYLKSQMTDKTIALYASLLV